MRKLQSPLHWRYLNLKFQKKRDSATRDHPSTESSPTSWLKEVTSPLKTEPEESQSTEPSSRYIQIFKKYHRMRVSPSSTRDQYFQWPTLDQTPTDHNSSSPLLIAHGSTESTSSSEDLLKDLVFSRILRLSEATVERPQKQLSSSTQVFCDQYI